MSKTSSVKTNWLAQHYEKLLLPVGIVVLAGSVGFTLMLQGQDKKRVEGEAWNEPEGEVKMAQAADLDAIQQMISGSLNPQSFERLNRTFFSSEKRVWAVDSFYPIPYASKVCTFTGVTQPDIEDFDQDEDGIPDLWESKYNLNPLLADDAATDADGDGFSNLEEYTGDTDPQDESSRPAYVTKLRVEDVINTPFKFLYQGYSEFVAGVKTFQLNLRAGGKTYFCDLGQEVMDSDPSGKKIRTGIVLDSYDADRDVLVLKQGNKNIELEKGKQIDAFEVKVVLVNLLDNSRMTKRVGEPIELKDGKYSVKSVSDTKVFVESASGVVTEIPQI